MVLYSKDFQKYDASDKREEEKEGHDSPKNFKESSKIMEADSIMKMEEDALLQRCFFVDFIVSDDGWKIRAVLKNP